MCKPFADPQIGGVGTRQSVYGSKGFLARITDMFLDHRYFDENASQSYLGPGGVLPVRAHRGLPAQAAAGRSSTTS